MMAGVARDRLLQEQPDEPLPCTQDDGQAGGSPQRLVHHSILELRHLASIRTSSSDDQSVVFTLADNVPHIS
jgi:hypothetical protein